MDEAFIPDRRRPSMVGGTSGILSSAALGAAFDQLDSRFVRGDSLGGASSDEDDLYSMAGGSSGDLTSLSGLSSPVGHWGSLGGATAAAAAGSGKDASKAQPAATWGDFPALGRRPAAGATDLPHPAECCSSRAAAAALSPQKGGLTPLPDIRITLEKTSAEDDFPPERLIYGLHVSEVKNGSLFALQN